MPSDRISRIIAVHAPFCYAIGVTAMEIAKGAGTGLVATFVRVVRAMFGNVLVVAVGSRSCGQCDRNADSAHRRGRASPSWSRQRCRLPSSGSAAFSSATDPRETFASSSTSVPSRSFCTPRSSGHGRATALDPGAFQSAVVTAAMAPGVNAYIFANMYGTARRVAASAVLIANGTLDVHHMGLAHRSSVRARSPSAGNLISSRHAALPLLQSNRHATTS